MSKPLFLRVFAYLRKHPGVPETQFGDKAAGQKAFVRKLRAGKGFAPATEERVHKWLDDNGG